MLASRRPFRESCSFWPSQPCWVEGKGSRGQLFPAPSTHRKKQGGMESRRRSPGHQAGQCCRARLGLRCLYSRTLSKDVLWHRKATLDRLAQLHSKGNVIAGQKEVIIPFWDWDSGHYSAGELSGSWDGNSWGHVRAFGCYLRPPPPLLDSVHHVGHGWVMRWCRGCETRVQPGGSMCDVHV